MNMDHELHDALRRKQAPPDLADRVLALVRRSSERATAARINQGEANSQQGAGATSSRSGSVGSNVRRWLAAAAVVAVSVGGAERYYEQQQAAEAARVQKELRIALQITSDTLALVQSKLSQPADNGGR